MQLTPTFTKQLTRCCLEMSEIEMMLFRKWLTARLQITTTLKKILAEAIYNFSCCNIHSKRHDKNHLPASWQFTSASVHKSSAEIFQAETCSKSREDRTELINLFDRSTDQPLFSAVLTVFLHSSIMWPFCTATQLHVGGAKFDLQSSFIFLVGYFASFRNSIASPR